MAKKCSSCGFSDNPDNAHYCGKCGKDIDIYGRWSVYDATRWRIYDPNHRAIIDRDKLKEYEELVRYKQLSIWKKIWESIKDFGAGLKTSEWLNSIIAWFILLGMLWFILYAVKDTTWYDVFNLFWHILSYIINLNLYRCSETLYP